ncbi:MAG: zinc-dependent alcohol dehydrogenase [Acidobacteriaceae bacterium]
MKALQLIQPRVFARVDSPIPPVHQDSEERILVKTRWVSLCGSDISFFNGNKRYVTYPLPIGAPIHESVGEVIESQSEQFQPGDMVLAIPEYDQGLAEYYLAQSRKAIPLPPGLASRDDSCLIQPLSTVLNAVNQLGEIKGKSVAVIGLGSIGLLFCWLLNKRGAGIILGIDPIPQRGLIAERMGATKTLSMRSTEAIHAARCEPDQWPPLDICIEAVGHQTQTLNDCIDLVRKQGSVLSFGVPDQPVYPIEYETFFRKNAVLVAVVTPDWSDYLSRACDLYLSSRDELAWLVTHRMPIRDAANAFSLYERHEENILKVVLDASAWD